MTTIVCDIYRSRRKEGMYLYVPNQAQLDALPEGLITHFGPAEHAMTLALSPERKLAHADAATVCRALSDQGYYLQMPPGESTEKVDG